MQEADVHSVSTPQTRTQKEGYMDVGTGGKRERERGRERERERVLE